jgi:hypothetical protein
MSVLLKLRNIASVLEQKFNGKRGTSRPKLILNDLMLSCTEKIKASDERSLEELEWDNLLILDACRHDIYEEIVGRDVEYNYSQASMTRYFIRDNFSEGEWNDVVYVTMNPHFSEEIFESLTGRQPKDVFFEVFESWKDVEEESKYNPEVLLRDAITAQKLFPDKKLVVHFMQPHVPFENHPKTPDKYNYKNKDYDVWEGVMRGEVDAEGTIEAYKKNLEFVMPFVEDLVEDLEGRTIISSDHGNLIGEGNFYGHPRGYSSVGLRKVPWDVRE